jgi:hypothetical protein
LYRNLGDRKVIMVRASRLVSVATVTLCAAVALNACGGSGGSADVAGAEPVFQPTATVKDLMLDIVDPSADIVWLSVTTVVNEDGIVETAPVSDEEWREVRRGAIALVEAANLLQIPGRHVAAPGEVSEVPGVELEPLEMEALINEDRAAWNTRAHALHDAGLEALTAIEAHDAAKVFEVGEHIERACEGCHSQYWYPNERIPPVSELLQRGA